MIFLVALIETVIISLVGRFIFHAQLNYADVVIIYLLTLIFTTLCEFINEH
jgi:hypothetical protein